MIQELNKLKRSIKAADPTLKDETIADLHKQVTLIIKDAKHSEKINNAYGLYFDKTYGDGLSAEEAAQDLGLT